MNLIRTDLIKCKVCNVMSQADLWEASTQDKLLNRKLRRQYVSIFNTEVWKKNNRMYVCPNCKKYINILDMEIVHRNIN